MMHTEVDLDYVFDVAVIATKATSVITWEQSVKHVEKGHLARVCRSLHTPQTKLIKPTSSSATKDKPPIGNHTHWVDMPTSEQETEPFPDDSI